MTGEPRRVVVLGRAFDVPMHDSALVVMVGGPDSAAAVTGTAYVGTVLPDEAWGSQRVSGDTVCLVSPRNREAHLLTVLRRSPAVRAFLQ